MIQNLSSALPRWCIYPLGQNISEKIHSKALSKEGLRGVGRAVGPSAKVPKCQIQSTIPTHTYNAHYRTLQIVQGGKKISKKQDHIKISTSWRRLSCPCNINSSPVCGWVGGSGWHPLWTRLTLTTRYHIGNISQIRSSQCPDTEDSSHIHICCSTLQSFENKSPPFLNVIDPPHFASSCTS